MFGPMRFILTLLALIVAILGCSPSLQAEWSLVVGAVDDRQQIQGVLESAVIYTTRTEAHVMWRHAVSEVHNVAVGALYRRAHDQLHLWTEDGVRYTEQRLSNSISRWNLMWEYHDEERPPIQRLHIVVPGSVRTSTGAAGSARAEEATHIGLEWLWTRRRDPVMLHVGVAPKVALPINGPGGPYVIGPSLELSAGVLYVITKDVAVNGVLTYRWKLDDRERGVRQPGTKGSASALRLALSSRVSSNTELEVGVSLQLQRSSDSQVQVGIRLF